MIINRHLQFHIGELKAGGTVVEGTAGRDILFLELYKLYHVYANC